jgi:hypothetical protein
MRLKLFSTKVIVATNGETGKPPGYDGFIALQVTHIDRRHGVTVAVPYPVSDVAIGPVLKSYMPSAFIP